MFPRKRSRGLEMLKASGVTLPAIKEANNEGANTPEVAKGGNGSPRTGLRGASGAKSPSKPGSSLAPKAACLPEQLRGLMRVWEAMLTARSMLNRRRERITLQALQPVVESYAGRQFKIEYVQQIKALYPEAFTWQYIRAPISKEDRTLEYQLLLRFERATASGAESGRDSGTTTTRFSDADEKAALESRLVAFLEQQQQAAKAAAGADSAGPSTSAVGPADGAGGAAITLPMAELPSKDGCIILSSSPMPSPDVSRRSSQQQGYSSTPSHSTAATGLSRQPSLRPMAADSPTSRPPLAPGGGSAANLAALGSPSSTASGAEGAVAKRRRLLDGSSAPGASEPSPFEPAAQARGRPPSLRAGEVPSPASNTTSGGVSRGPAPSGGAGGGVASRQGSGASLFAPGGPLPTGLPPTPSSARRNPLLARLMSADALVLLDKSESIRASSPKVHAKQRQLQATAQLSSAFDVLRVVFGVRGSCLRPKDEVVAAMRDKSAARGGLTMAEAQLQLEVLAREAPEFLRIESQTQLRDAGATTSGEQQMQQQQQQMQQQGPRLMVRIDRGADLDTIRCGLAGVASRAAVELQQLMQSTSAPE